MSPLLVIGFVLVALVIGGLLVAARLAPDEEAISKRPVEDRTPDELGMREVDAEADEIRRLVNEEFAPPSPDPNDEAA
jgi:hypothetical protein